MNVKKIVSIAAAAAVFISSAGFSAFAADGVKINEKNFPDEVFREYVSKEFDLDGNGELSKSEISEAERINVRNNVIRSLKGLEYFTELVYLDCEHNFDLGSIDVSKNTKLEYLSCGKIGLTEIDLSSNKNLTWFDCYGNDIEKLDVSKNTELTYLACYANELKTLDVTKNTKLVQLYCEKNHLKKLDLTKNKKLVWLNCGDNYFKTLDVSKNTELESFFCDGNQLKTIDLSKNAKINDLVVSRNDLICLDLQNTTGEFVRFKCENNEFETSAEIGKTYKLSGLKKYGFDPKKASDWKGAEYNEKNGTIKITDKKVSYTYDCGHEITAEFTLILSE